MKFLFHCIACITIRYLKRQLYIWETVTRKLTTGEVCSALVLISRSFPVRMMPVFRDPWCKICIFLGLNTLSVAENRPCMTSDTPWSSATCVWTLPSLAELELLQNAPMLQRNEIITYQKGLQWLFEFFLIIPGINFRISQPYLLFLFYLVLIRKLQCLVVAFLWVMPLMIFLLFIW